MISKENVAAVMEHGNAEAKISLLKKAVISVTKQKQVLEQHNKQLQDQMAAIGEELTLMQEENKKLQKKLNAVEGELEAERKRGNFGASVKTTWRGISSFVTGADGEDVGTGTKRPKGTAVRVNLAPEDQEKIVTENKNIHMELFDLKTKYEEERRNWAAEMEQQFSEQATLRTEIRELQNLLDLKTQHCDQLNVECTRQAALAQFCHHFFVVSWEADKQKQENRGVEQPHRRLCVTLPSSLMMQEGSVPPHDVREELAAGTLTHIIAFIRTLMSGVSVLVASLRDSFGPQLKAATLGDIRCYQNRLTTLLEAHAVRKVSVLHHVEELEGAFAAPIAPGEKLTQVQSAQCLLLSSFKQWLLLMCQHSRLLVDACVTVEICSVSGENGSTQAFIESASQETINVLAAICGLLDALGKVFDDSSNVLRQEVGDSVDWLLALERFWWEGCSNAEALRQAVESLRGLLYNILEFVTNNEPVRDALQFVHKSLDIFALRGWRAMKHITTFSTTETPRAPSSLDLLPTLEGVMISQNDRELAASLAAADRAAVCYHTQMNLTLLELAETREALASAKQEVARLASLNQQQAEDAERVREALTTQICLLSDHLVEITNKNNSDGINNL